MFVEYIFSFINDFKVMTVVTIIGDNFMNTVILLIIDKIIMTYIFTDI